MTKSDDFGEAIPAKLGTIPMVLYARDKRTPLEVGAVIRIKRTRGAHWETVKVTRLGPGEHFFADLI